jgi:membrane protease YdiL (CAAX protease family)
VPELMRVTGFAATSVVIGLVWAAWHAPVIAFTTYNSGAPLAFNLACYTLMCVALSFVLSWLRLRSDSVWPAVLLHTTHNAFIAELLTPLTGRTAATPWLLEEWGAGLPLTTAVAAVLAWRAWRATSRA